MNHVLLIWENIPGSLYMYLIPLDVLEEGELELFKLIDGKFMNSNDLNKEELYAFTKIEIAVETTSEFIDNYLDPIPKKDRANVKKKWANRFARYKLIGGLVEPVTISTICVTGCVC